MRLFYTCAGLFGWLLLSFAALAGEPAAAVFMYNRFGERGAAITNVRLDQFDAQLRELASGHYRVAPLPEIVDALLAGHELPERTVAITVDDAYRSFYTHGWPKLRDAKMPFTLFVWTDAIDQKLPDYMSWDEIRALRDAGVSIGNHGAAHQDMALNTDAANRADIEKASRRFEQELGMVPALFAYPYGGYGVRDRDLLAKLGFKAAFGHHSGVAYAGADPLMLPRFALNEKHGGMRRFTLAANALPLPVSAITPADPVLRAGNNPPAFGFTVAEGVRGLGGLNCFASHQDAALKIERIGRRVEVRMDAPFPRGNHRVNCTAPDPSGRWRWFGQPFAVP